MKNLISHIINSENNTTIVSFDKVHSIHGINKISTDYSTYLADESKLSGEAEWLFFPKSESEIISILNFLRENKIQTCISAARTGIVGSCVPIFPTSGSVLSLEKMNKIVGFGFDRNKGNYFFRVEPGITLNEINHRLMKKNFDDITELTPGSKEKFKETKKKHDYPVDPTEMSATIGGTVATNASGARSLKYGSTREWIKRIRVILSTGVVLEIPRGKYFASNEGIFEIRNSDGSILQFKIPNYIFNTTVKNAAGIFSKPNMDLIDLFIGSEGILGIITQIDIWISEKRRLISNVLFLNSEEDAINFTELIRVNEELSPEFIEFFSSEALSLLREVQKKNLGLLDIPQIPIEARSAIFFDFPYDEENFDRNFNKINNITEKCNTDLSNSWSGYEHQYHIRFKHFRHSLPEIINTIIAKRKQKIPNLHKLGTDMCVPEKNFRKMMKYYHSVLQSADLEYVIFGHIGENHVHVNILPKNMDDLRLGEKIYEKFAVKAVEYGGSISAEHGVGKIKKEYLKIMYSPDDLNEMRTLKKVLDPTLTLNYGNIFNLNS